VFAPADKLYGCVEDDLRYIGNRPYDADRIFRLDEQAISLTGFGITPKWMRSI